MPHRCASTCSRSFAVIQNGNAKVFYVRFLYLKVSLFLFRGETSAKLCSFSKQWAYKCNLISAALNAHFFSKNKI